MGLVVDFHGTIRSHHDEPDRLDPELIKHIIFLAQSGLCIGVATGRGKSITKILRNNIPENLWQDILVGYANGSVILPLNQEMPELPQNHELAFLESELKKTKTLTDRFEIISRNYSITLKSLRDTSIIKTPEKLWQIIRSTQLNDNLRILETGYTIDIVLHHVSKTAVKSEIIKLSEEKGGNVLSIADQGQPGGNDYDLLQEDFGLSVELVSPSSSGCLNLAPKGVTDPLHASDISKPLLNKT